MLGPNADTKILFQRVRAGGKVVCWGLTLNQLSPAKAGSLIWAGLAVRNQVQNAYKPLRELGHLSDAFACSALDIKLI